MHSRGDRTHAACPAQRGARAARRRTSSERRSLVRSRRCERVRDYVCGRAGPPRSPPPHTRCVAARWQYVTLRPSPRCRLAARSARSRTRPDPTPRRGSHVRSRSSVERALGARQVSEARVTRRRLASCPRARTCQDVPGRASASPRPPPGYRTPLELPVFVTSLGPPGRQVSRAILGAAESCTHLL